MSDYSDQNMQHVLEDPGAYFDRPSSVADAALSPENKLRVLKAWRRWLLSDEWHAEHTDESHRDSDLADIDSTESKIRA